MKILSVAPKDVYITLEFSVEQVKQILDFLDHAEVRFDGEDEPEMKVATDYIKEVLYPQLDQVYQDVKGER